MTINPRNYGGSRRDKWNHRVGINIRMRRHKSLGGPPTFQETYEALTHLLDTGTVPHGWQFAAIHWGRPEEASRYWQTGTVRDFDALRDVIEHELHRMKFNIVRPGE